MLNIFVLVAWISIFVAMAIAAMVLSNGFREVDWDLGGFDQKWPPIDDDEFIRRCHPGANREIALRVRRVVAKQLGIPYQQIYPEQNFVFDLGCD